MSERPDPPPWGAAITTALHRSGMSARQAARQAGISEGRWRQITSGYQVVSPGVYAPVRGPAATLARMAAVAGVSAADLQAAGREDAARLLDEAPARGADTELLDRIRAMDSEQARALLVQIAAQLGITVAGAAAAADERQYGT
jgi:transcriptional regulator with XRE-family HTH domain